MWDKIKGAIFEGGDAVTEAPVAQAPQGAPQAAPTAPRPVGSGMTYVPTQSVNQDMVAAIRKQTFSRNTALTSLITASDSLADVIPDPAMRLKAAQKMAGGGRGAKELADAVAIHLNDVDAAEMQFGQALDGKIKAEVGGLIRQAEVAEGQVTAAQQEIQNLNARIQQLQQQAADQSTNAMNLRSQASTKEHELRQADGEFKAAATAVRNELNGHKATILSTLG